MTITMKIKKIVATTHEARFVRPEGGRGLFGLVVGAMVVIMGPSAMVSGGGGCYVSVLFGFYCYFLLRKCECECE